MKYLQYLIPRFILLGGLCLGLWLSSALLARYSVKASESHLSHSIDTDEVQLDLSEHSLALSSVTIGDPKEDPVYLEMDKVTLKFDPKASVNRRLVVRDGVVTNLHLVDTRLESHRRSTEDQSASAFAGTTEVIRETLSDKLLAAILASQPADLNYHAGVSNHSTWWKAVQPALLPSQQTSNISPEAFQARWEAPITACQKKVALIQAEIETLQAKASQPTNPLRSHGNSIQMQQRITELTTQLVDLQSEVQTLRAAASKELESALTDAARQARNEHARLGLPEPNSTVITNTILKGQAESDLQAMLKWVDWAGNLVPNLQVKPDNLRGRNVSYGKKEESSMQIDKLTLVGTTAVGGSYYRFMGRLSNFSNDPASQHEPTSLTLRAQGPQHIILNAVYDRRQDGEKTYINIKSPDLIHPETQLPAGDSENALGLALQVSPTTAYSQIALTLDGTQVSGTVTVRHSNARIQLNEGEIQNATLAGLINYELGACDEFSTTYHLEGSVDQVMARPECDLGQQIASAVKNATVSHRSKLLELQLAQSEANAREQIQESTNWMKKATNDVFALIQSGRTQIASLQGSVERLDDSSLRLR